MAKGWSLIVVRCVVGTTRADEDVDRRRRRQVTTTGWMTSCKYSVVSTVPWRQLYTRKRN